MSPIPIGLVAASLLCAAISEEKELKESVLDHCGWAEKTIQQKLPERAAIVQFYRDAMKISPYKVNAG